MYHGIKPIALPELTSNLLQDGGLIDNLFADLQTTARGKRSFATFNTRRSIIIGGGLVFVLKAATEGVRHSTRCGPAMD